MKRNSSHDLSQQTFAVLQPWETDVAAFAPFFRAIGFFVAELLKVRYALNPHGAEPGAGGRACGPPVDRPDPLPASAAVETGFRASNGVSVFARGAGAAGRAGPSVAAKACT